MTDKKDDEKIRVFSYLRVSTEMQKIDMQRESVNIFLKNNPHIELIREFIDDAFSGALGWERPDFKEMYDALDKVDGIIIYNWDRLSREEEFAVMLMYSLKRKNKVVYISSSGEMLNFTNLPARLKTFIDSAYSERERVRIKKRQMDGIATYKKQHGRWGAKVKWGQSLTGAKISEKRFWKLYKQYRKAGISKSGIARILNLSRPTLYNRLDENYKKYNMIESNLLIKKEKKEKELNMKEIV